MPLDIRVLGPLQILVDGEPLRVDTRKALAILALLAVERRPYARDELAAMFWPESDDESARGAFRRTLSVLRGALGGRWLHVDRATVSLAAAPDVTIDVATIEEAAAGDDAAALSVAASLARGPFLAGFSLRDSPDFDDWRATRAVSVERRLVDILERLTRSAEETGDLDAAVAAATRLIELDPLDEPAHRQLMVLLARAGDRAGAIREYRTTVGVLERELGVAPLAATTELYEAIRDDRLPSPASRPRAAPSRVEPLDMAALVSPADLPMIGRDEELARLVATHRASSPDGSIATISGEAGIGKSRLVDELAAEATADGARVIRARAFPAEGTIPYAPITELLRTGLAMADAAARLAVLPPDVLPEIARLVALPAGMATNAPVASGDSPAARVRLLDALATTLTVMVAGPVAGLVIVEDTHWADDASREALRYLARRLEGRALLLVLTWRTEELHPTGEVGDALVGLPPTTAVELGRLDAGEVGAIVRAAGAAAKGWDPAALAAESEGLPLYVVEALEAGPNAAGEAPRGVRSLLRARLASVGETAAQVLAASAVIGRSFDLATVGAASGRSEDETIEAIEELVRRGIVREVAGHGEPAFDFAHGRLRDAAYEGVGLARRRLLHRRVADVLRNAGRAGDAAALAQIAAHEQAGGRDAEAAEAYRAAGMSARTVSANREAHDHLTSALALGHPDVVGLQVAIGEVRTSLGDYAGAIAALEAAAAVVEPANLSGIELRLGRVHARRGDMTTAASHLDAALAGSLPPSEEAVALVERGGVALRAGDLDGAAMLAARAATHEATLLDRRAHASAARLLGLVAHRRGDLEAARTELTRSIELSSGTADTDAAAAIAARNALALVEAERGDRARAVTLLEQALADCGRAAEPHLEAAVENNLADQLHAAGRHEDAMIHLKRAVALFADVRGRPGELEPEIWKLVSW